MKILKNQRDFKRQSYMCSVQTKLKIEDLNLYIMKLQLSI